MSEGERLETVEGQLARTRAVASWALALALVGIGWGVMAMVVNNNQSNSIRDLQHRISILEQKVK